MTAVATTERLAELRMNLVALFSDEELRTLCFDLGVDPDGLPGRSRDDRHANFLLTSTVLDAYPI